MKEMSREHEDAIVVAAAAVAVVVKSVFRSVQISFSFCWEGKAFLFLELDDVSCASRVVSLKSRRSGQLFLHRQTQQRERERQMSSQTPFVVAGVMSAHKVNSRKSSIRSVLCPKRSSQS